MSNQPGPFLDRWSSRLIAIAVILLLIVIPASLWAAKQFFGWEPPGFLRDLLGG